MIERRTKPSLPWGEHAQAAFGTPPVAAVGSVNQGVLALGQQDVDPDGLVPPHGVACSA